MGSENSLYHGMEMDLSVPGRARAGPLPERATFLRRFRALLAHSIPKTSVRIIAGKTEFMGIAHSGMPFGYGWDHGSFEVSSFPLLLTQDSVAKICCYQYDLLLHLAELFETTRAVRVQDVMLPFTHLDPRGGPGTRAGGIQHNISGGSSHRELLWARIMPFIGLFCSRSAQSHRFYMPRYSVMSTLSHDGSTGRFAGVVIPRLESRLALGVSKLSITCLDFLDIEDLENLLVLILLFDDHISLSPEAFDEFMSVPEDTYITIVRYSWNLKSESHAHRGLFEKLFLTLPYPLQEMLLPQLDHITHENRSDSEYMQSRNLVSWLARNLEARLRLGMHAFRTRDIHPDARPAYQKLRERDTSVSSLGWRYSIQADQGGLIVLNRHMDETRNSLISFLRMAMDRLVLQKELFRRDAPSARLQSRIIQMCVLSWNAPRGYLLHPGRRPNRFVEFLCFLMYFVGLARGPLPAGGPDCRRESEYLRTFRRITGPLGRRFCRKLQPAFISRILPLTPFLPFTRLRARQRDACIIDVPARDGEAAPVFLWAPTDDFLHFVYFQTLVRVHQYLHHQEDEPVMVVAINTRFWAYVHNTWLIEEMAKNERRKVFSSEA